MRLRPRGLRARSVAAFATLALLLSVSLSATTYQLARRYLLAQRESLATRQVMLDALVAQGLVAAADTSEDGLAGSLSAVTNARAVLHVDGGWYSAVVELSESSIPAALVAEVESGFAARQRVTVNSVPFLLVGVPLPTADAAYYEFVPLTEFQKTLETLATVLLVGATVTTIVGALAGWFAARRVVRPLTEVAAAALAVSGGDLARRLDVGSDPDLEPVAAAFNDMASSLEQRIDRELRFTADVSHELRTPLTAMASAVSLARRVVLPARAEFAVEVLNQQVDHLSRLTTELLEISRIDAGVAELRLEEFDVVDTTRTVVRATGTDPAIVRSWLGHDVRHLLDRTRFERVIANLVENADRYGAGATSVELEVRANDLVVWVDDGGPGVAPAERLAIFGRFHRGEAEQPADRPKGTGLGLSLVDEHVRLHGGRAWVTDSPWGGARFVVCFPRRQGDAS